MNRHVVDICKIGQGKFCCRYLVAGSDGLECAKHTTLKALLDNRVYTGKMNAQGDNCNFKNVNLNINDENTPTTPPKA